MPGIASNVGNEYFDGFAIENEVFRIAFQSNDNKFFTNSQIILGTNGILNEKGEIFMRYEKITKCDICSNPVGIKKFENGGCCVQFQYLSKNYTLCADDKYYKVVYFILLILCLFFLRIAHQLKTKSCNFSLKDVKQGKV